MQNGSNKPPNNSRKKNCKELCRKRYKEIENRVYKETNTELDKKRKQERLVQTRHEHELGVNV